MTAVKDVDIAIIGGGVVGLASAYFLQKRGLRVAVIEKGSFASEQSRRNSGFIRQQGRDIRELALIRRSLDLWEGFAAESNTDFGFRRAGNLAVTNTPAKIAAMHDWVKTAAEFGIRSQVLDGAGLASVVPRLQQGFLGGFYTANDSQGEPFLAGQALAARLRDVGVEMIDFTLVTGLHMEAGKVAGVETEAGLIRCGHTLLAGGLWSRMFLQRHGVNLPLSDLRITVGRTEAFDHGLTIPTWTPDVLVRPRLDGGLTIALGQDGPCDFDLTADSPKVGLRFMPTYLANRSGVKIHTTGRHVEYLRWRRAYAGKGSAADRAEIANSPAEPNALLMAKCIAAARSQFGFSRQLSLIESWACRADVTPDGIPVIDRLDQLPGLSLACGMSGHGFGISMGVGEAIAEMLTGSQASGQLEDFSIKRFGKMFLKPMNVL